MTTIEVIKKLNKYGTLYIERIEDNKYYLTDAENYGGEAVLIVNEDTGEVVEIHTM